MSEITEVYTNTPENQEKFEQFWDSLEKIQLPKTSDQMLRYWLKVLDEDFKDPSALSLELVKEILMSCLRGC